MSTSLVEFERLTQQLASTERPVLVLSGYAPDNLVELLATARTGFLAKPFAARDLDGAVHELLAESLRAVASPRRGRGHDKAATADGSTERRSP